MNPFLLPVITEQLSEELLYQRNSSAKNSKGWIKCTEKPIKDRVQPKHESLSGHNHGEKGGISGEPYIPLGFYPKGIYLFTGVEAKQSAVGRGMVVLVFLGSRNQSWSLELPVKPGLNPAERTADKCA